MKKCIVLFFLILNTLFATAQAADLIQIYQQALACDPTFKAAQAQYLATRENMSIARAALLPNVVLSGFTQRQVINANLNPATPNIFGLAGTFYNTQNQYMLNLTQPIFNYAAWAKLSTADYQVKQAEATFAAAAQDLMMRTAQAYFGVLQASDNLRYTQAQKRAVAEQLRQTRQQYEVGLVAITGVKEAEANYDSLVASEIAAKNNLANAVEQLRAITTKTYPSLMGADSGLPLLQPNPADIEQWVSVAERQNYSLQSSINAAMSAEQNIKAQFGGHLPVISGTAGYAYNHNTQGGFTATGFIGPSELQSGQIGVSLNFPVYQGGLVNAQTEQARYQYQNAVSQMEYTHRTVVQNTRNAYLGVITGIGKVAADRETVIATQVALKATLDGYEAGTRNMVDVLIAQSNLYQAQMNYSVDRYNYLISVLSLKQAAGTLSPSDLGRVNSWLQQRYNILGKIADIGSYASEIPASMISNNEHQPKKVTVKPVLKKKHDTKKIKKQGLIKLPILEKTTDTLKQKPSQINTATMAHDKTKTTEKYYTIALFETRYEKHAEDFIRSQGLSGKAHYFSMRNAKGEIRYQVVYGHYKTVKEAEKAMKALPEKLQKLNLWVKLM